MIIYDHVTPNERSTRGHEAARIDAGEDAQAGTHVAVRQARPVRLGSLLGRMQKTTWIMTVPHACASACRSPHAHDASQVILIDTHLFRSAPSPNAVSLRGDWQASGHDGSPSVSSTSYSRPEAIAARAYSAPRRISRPLDSCFCIFGAGSH